jgi:hypothetical protein
MHRVRRTTVAITAVALIAAGCGGDDDNGDAASPTVTAAATTSPAATSPPTSVSSTTATPTTAVAASTTRPVGTVPTTTVPFIGTTEATRVAAGGGTALLTAVRSGVQPGYDRVVFEFDGTGLPGVEVAYAPRPIRADGSGDEVAIEGDAVLVVRMSPAAGVDLSTSTPIITYNGPQRLQPRQANVIEIVRTGDFEGVLTWAIGQRARTPYRVLTLQSPSRVVIDIVTP